MRPLRVAYLLLHFPYLTETFVAEEIRAIREQGVEVEIVSLLEPGPGPVQEASANLLPLCWYAPALSSQALWQAQLYFLWRAGWRYFALLFNLLWRCPYPKQPLQLIAKRLVIFLKAVAVAYHLRDHQIELLHAHFAWLPGAAAWICARLLDRPFTVTAHAYDLYASPDLLPVAAGEADQVIAISDYNRRFLVANGVCRADAVSVIHCGINAAHLASLPVETANPAPGLPIRLLSVGSLNLKKGHEYLIEACRLLNEWGLSFTCTIIGGGERQAELCRLVEGYGLHGKVELRGAQSNQQILQAYRQHDIFVLAAVVAPNGDQDGIPVVMMEAGAFGLPLVSTAVSGIPELVQHQKTGLLVPAKEPKALAEAIAQLATDRALRQQYGGNPRTLVAAEYDSTTNAARQIEAFHRVLANHGKMAMAKA